MPTFQIHLQLATVSYFYTCTDTFQKKSDTYLPYPEFYILITKGKIMKKKIMDLIIDNMAHDEELCTAEYISEQLKLSRNRVSTLLNELVSENVLIKIKTRPVLFLDKSSIERKYNQLLKKSQFSSMEELTLTINADPTDQIIGFDSSLKNIIFQSKASVSYGSNGLPIMFVGESGTGKTFLAKKIVEFAKFNKIVNSSSPFIHINCSEYANNPELFLSNFFGYVKGAYTGAFKDTSGYLKEADGGFLFLDEIHALSPSCQEKLFQFMDSGNYHKMGDSEKEYQANVRFLFATTDYPSEKLLPTFIRRIPVILRVPSFDNRSTAEKIELIHYILKIEEMNIEKNIFISESVIHYILSNKFTGNVGEIKNILKRSVANQSFNSHNKDLEINLKNLEFNAYNDSLLFDETMLSIDDLITMSKQHKNNNLLTIIFNIAISHDDPTVDTNSYLKNMWELIKSLKSEVESSNQKDLELLGILMEAFSFISSEKSDFYFEFNKHNFELEYLSLLIQNISLNSNDFFISSNEYTQYIVNILKIKRKESEVADYIIGKIEEKFSCKNNIFIKLFLISFIEYHAISTTPNNQIGVIMAHGNIVASEIAKTVNTMLNSYIFEGINLPLDINEKESYFMIEQKFKNYDTIKKLIILADSGIYSQINIDTFTFCEEVILINSVDIMLCLTIGNDILDKKDTKQINYSVAEYKNHINCNVQSNKTKLNAIVCSCASGKESNKKISNILKKTLIQNKQTTILDIDFKDIKQQQLLNSLHNKYNILFLVGTLDPELSGIPFVSIGDLISIDTSKNIRNILENHFSQNEILTINKNILREFTLTNLMNEITILDSKKLLSVVSVALDDLQSFLKFSLPISVSLGLYIHTCCMIERTLRINDGSLEEDENETIDKEFKDFFEKSFSTIEKYYSIKIPNNEILYIYNYMYSD